VAVSYGQGTPVGWRVSVLTRPLPCMQTCFDRSVLMYATAFWSDVINSKKISPFLPRGWLGGRAPCLRGEIRERLRGGLVIKANKLLYHSPLGLRVIKKKKKIVVGYPRTMSSGRNSRWRLTLTLSLNLKVRRRAVVTDRNQQGPRRR
jgi:hypothetical protein